MAHRRLSIVDLTLAASQPMVSERSGGVLAFNGEIYNYIELRSQLKELGHHFKGTGDTEVLLRALEVWGAGALGKLNGMFAFTYWDPRSRSLLIARDRFGEKPLFIGRGELGVTVFASEMKAILAHPQMRVSEDLTSLDRYTRGDWFEDDEATFFRSVSRFPPAHAALFASDGVEQERWRYWTPDYESIDSNLSVDAAVQQFGELFRESVSLRLRSDVAVGSSLSGGLDSSSIVAQIAALRSTGTLLPKTFSAVFPNDPTLSEEGEIRQVVETTGVESFSIVPDPCDLMSESRSLHWHQEEPFLSASIYLQWCVSRLASKNHVAVMLDGQGADELLAGYQYYFRQYQLDLLDRGNFKDALVETASFSDRLHAASQQYKNPERRFDAHVAFSLEELNAMSKSRSSRPGSFSTKYSSGLPRVSPGNRLRRTLAEALQYNSLPMLLRYADRNSMAFSREVRMPFLDHRLVDFILRLPDSLLVREGWQKWILRRAAPTAVPEAVRWRADKVGYAAPLDRWLRVEMKEWAAERLFESTLANLPGYDRRSLERIWTEHMRGQLNHSWTIWRWISLAEWRSLTQSGAWKAGIER